MIQRTTGADDGGAWRMMFDTILNDRQLQDEGDSPPLYVDYDDHGDGDTSLFDPNYTYSNDKLSCMREFYFVHMVLNYFIFLSGIGCFITRLIPPRYKWIHSWFGRCYILSMLASTFSSLLIHNTGLPLSTIISFGAVFIGLTVGWIVIIFHKGQMDTAAMKLVQERLTDNPESFRGGKGGGGDTTLASMLSQAKVDIIESKTFRQRFISWKALHGMMFFMSWFNIAGRIFSSNQSGDFVCYTYPVYKPIDTKEHPEGASQNLTLVPNTDPDWDRLPWSDGVWAWSMQIIFGSLAAAIVVGATFSFFAARKAQKAAGRGGGDDEEEDGDVQPTSEFGKEEEEKAAVPVPAETGLAVDVSSTSSSEKV